MLVSGLITSILRFAAFFATDAFDDGTWASVTLMQWCIIEPGVYLIAACLVAYRPLIIYLVRESPLSHVLSRSQHSQPSQPKRSFRGNKLEDVELQSSTTASKSKNVPRELELEPDDEGFSRLVDHGREPEYAFGTETVKSVGSASQEPHRGGGTRDSSIHIEPGFDFWPDSQPRRSEGKRV